MAKDIEQAFVKKEPAKSSGLLPVPQQGGKVAATDDPGEPDAEPDAEPVLEEPLGKLPEPLVAPPLIELVPLPAAPEPELAVFSFTWPLVSRQWVAAETLLPDEAPLEGDVED